MSDIEALRGIPVFDGLNEAQLGELLGAIRVQHVPEGTVILREGTRGDALFILSRGSVEVTKRLGLGISIALEKARDNTLVRLDAPQFFGEMGLLEEADRSATITAIRECELLEITRTDFERLAQLDPMLGYLVVRNIASVLSARLRSTNLDVVKLTMALSLALGNR